MTLCGEHSIVNHDAHRVAVATLRCKRWSCDDCFGLRLRKLRRECRDGNPTTFLTLTARRSSETDPHEAARGLVRAWRIVRQRLKTQKGIKSVQFMAVFETTKQGMPHLHILARMPYVEQKLISQWMDELTNSPIVDIRRVRSTKQAAAYVSKYVSKAPEPFKGCKRYWRSLGYLASKHERRNKVFDRWWGWDRRRASWRSIADGYRLSGMVAKWSDGFCVLADDLVHLLQYERSASKARGSP